MKLHILLADDDIDDRFFFEKALKEIPIATQLAFVSDGEELIEYLVAHQKNLPDVLFLDLSMPRKTGFECLAEIKENPLFKAMPVIMISTSFRSNMLYEQSMIQMLYKIGAADFIRKPSGFEELKAVVERALFRVIEQNSKPAHQNSILF